MPSERDDPAADRDAAASRFVAALGATMSAANYPVTMVSAVMLGTSKAYGLENQFLALPNDVQVGSPTGESLYISNPDYVLRFDQAFPLAKLVARAPSGTVLPKEGMAELERIRKLDKRFPIWLTVLGYAVQSTGLALILQPTPLTLLVDSNLVTTELNRLGPGAPYLGVLVYGIGIWIGNAVLGSYASGFGGGLALILFALAISHRPPQHRGVRRHADLDDVHRRRRTDPPVVMAGGDPADRQPLAAGAP